MSDQSVVAPPFQRLLERVASIDLGDSEDWDAIDTLDTVELTLREWQSLSVDTAVLVASNVLERVDREVTRAVAGGQALLPPDIQERIDAQPAMKAERETFLRVLAFMEAHDSFDKAEVTHLRDMARDPT
jgi:hypothetical protein